jgi:hypothetical protein
MDAICFTLPAHPGSVASLLFAQVDFPFQLIESKQSSFHQPNDMALCVARAMAT